MKLIRIMCAACICGLLLNACQKEYSTENGGLTIPSGSWQFKDSSTLYLGNMDSAVISTSTTSNTQELHLFGTSFDGSQVFDMQLFADTLKVGTYKASLFEATFKYSATAKTLFEAGQLTGEFTVVITAFSSTSATGTFSGTATDSSGKSIQITAGKFISSIGTKAAAGVSTGVLGDSSGNCKPVILSGPYVQGIALTSANTVQVQVNVATAGTYSILTNTVDGVSFSKTGTFTTAGLQTVTLTGSGTPATAGAQTYTVTYGSSTCAFNINFAIPAAGTLGGTPGACTQFVIAGTYQQGLALNATNTVQIHVNVTTLGSYYIATNTNDGVLFSQSGIFTTLGDNAVTLIGSGTPIDSAKQNFTVSFGASTCTFSITFLPGVVLDYFPVTANSHWTYSLNSGTPSDSVYTKVINYVPNFGGKIYSTIAAYDVPPTIAFDSNYYRKPGGDYYEYIDYSDVLDFDQSVSGEYIFLKDYENVNATWTSPTVSGTISSIPVSGYITMTILDKGPVTIGNYNFPAVIKVKYEYTIVGNGVVETDERWFAKDVGEIYDSIDSGNQIYEIGNWQVF